MCGVAAIFSYHPSAPSVDRTELIRIRDCMSARGPDAKGEWYSNDHRVAIGHRRLSVIDLSERANQPMCSPDGRVVLSFNGEIYNYRALRRCLENNGRKFETHSDTEVILQLYALKGEAMLDDLRGMFALVIWDENRDTLLLARDAYGIKPLYYANDGWSVRVGSQVKALLAGGKVSRQPDPAGKAGFFLFGSVPEPYTCFQEIRSVPAGCVLRIDRRGPSEPEMWKSIPRIYVDALRRGTSTDTHEDEHVVRDALLASVKHHLVSDVPVGVFLSSGIDSSALVGLTRDAGEYAIETVTLAFPEFAGGRQDESRIAERTANAYGTRHTTCYVTEGEFAGQLPSILEAMDQPSIDGINTWLVSKVASELGLKVCLSGLGGDELFGGYPSFQDIPIWTRAMHIPGHIPILGDMCRFVFDMLSLESLGLSPKTGGFVKYAGTYPGAYFLKRGLFMPWELSGILGDEAAREGLRRLEPLAYISRSLQPDPKDAFARVACMESSLYLRNQLLRDADWAGMAHSLEIRVPLVDTTLLAGIASIAAKSGAETRKSLLVSAPAAPLGAEVAKRNKTGFTVPIESWMLNLRDSLDSWRKVPALSRNGCHWARRLAYAIASQAVA
jgi:asparagine synthase (glutamine-hydrolysing)